MTHLIVNSSAVVLIVLIIWWFWIAKPRLSHVQSGVVDILVDNGVYSPARIEVPVGKPTILRFLRKDASPCAEKVIFEKLNISADLPVDKPREIEVKPEQAGEYEFTCQMQMYRGQLVAH